MVSFHTSSTPFVVTEAATVGAADFDVDEDRGGRGALWRTDRSLLRRLAFRALAFARLLSERTKVTARLGDFDRFCRPFFAFNADRNGDFGGGDTND